jgi:hypothetical protein
MCWMGLVMEGTELEAAAAATEGVATTTGVPVGRADVGVGADAVAAGDMTREELD